MHPHIQIYNCMCVNTIHKWDPAAFSLRHFFCPVSPKKMIQHWAKFIPQPPLHADAELVSFIHPCALPTHSLSHEWTQESMAGLHAMKFIYLILFPQI